MPDPVTGVIGVTSLAGAAASNKAGKDQAKAAGEAGRMSTQQYLQSRADLMPYQKTGGAANARLATLLGIGSRVDPNDPAIQARAKAIFSERDAAHKKRYGVGLYDPNVDPAALERILSGSTQQAINEYMRTNPGNADPEFGSLLDEFTGEDLENEPGYQFELAEGNKAIDRAAGAGSGRFSGATLKALQRFGQDHASTKFDNAYNRDAGYKSQVYGMLSGQSGQGANAAGMTAGLGANAASAAGGALMNGADARAAGLVGGVNSLTSGVGNYLNYQQGQQTLEYLKGLRKGSLSGASGWTAGNTWGVQQ